SDPAASLHNSVLERAARHAAAPKRTRNDRFPKRFRAPAGSLPDLIGLAAAASPLHRSAAKLKQSAGLRSPAQFDFPPPTPDVRPRWNPPDSQWPESPTPASSVRRRRLWCEETPRRDVHCRPTTKHFDHVRWIVPARAGP